MSDILKQTLEHCDWLKSAALQQLFDVLEEGGEEIRVNGGAVRNSLLGESIGDVDLSTTLLPDAVLKRLEAAKIKAVATGLAHGTVTAIIDKHPFEITTLRRDIETDGRRAVVSFGKDWLEDAKRRDFTMNALYCDRHGQIYDPLGGYDDLMARNVRFIGDAGERIGEDYLRILRFFRFFAQYGNGRPDGEGLKACARLKTGIPQLSAERVWMELKKIIGVGDPSRALLWMRTTGVLTTVLPESEKWGIDFIRDLIDAEQDLSWPVDVMTRLQMMVPPVVDKMADLAGRLRFSKAEKRRVVEWAEASLPEGGVEKDEFGKQLYWGSQPGICDRLRGEIVRQRHRAANAEEWLELLDYAQRWKRPEFPLKGRDLEKSGMESGPKMGEVLKKLEKTWVASGFVTGKEELLRNI
ncbi:MAG: CCA tRNA nucleotidyltransferase [Rhizobiaceae bacterium]|nr:CCA tRNA nucleotidyltransferase [Rhizobiaceae bacterium]